MSKRTNCPHADTLLATLAMILVSSGAPARSAEPVGLIKQTFQRDPEWDGFRNRLLPDERPVVRQDFGYRRTNHAGGEKGEIGGSVQRAFTPASYAMAIPEQTLEDRLTASGKFAVTRAGGSSGIMFGWFNRNSRGWRTPNSLAFRIDGNGGKYWVFYEYGTRSWRSGGGGAFEGERYQTTPTAPFPADGSVHEWSLDYDPQANDGRGVVTFTLDGKTWDALRLQPGHKLDGAHFDRFGLFNVQIAGDSMDVYFDDLAVSGRPLTFDKDPGWESQGNTADFSQRVVRPFHDFGYARSSHVGGDTGEIGGIVFRDEQPAYYAAPTGRLTLDDELFAAGKVAFLAAGSDSGVKIGWFDSSAKRNTRPAGHEARQRNFLGITIEGPSRIGHYFRPAYANTAGAGRAPNEDPKTGNERPVIRPDGTVHEWSVQYDPAAADGNGRVTVQFDDELHTLDVDARHRGAGAAFDRFGLFNIQSGGHHVQLYVDDVRYTAAAGK